MFCCWMNQRLPWNSRTESLVMEIIQKQKGKRIILMVSHKAGHEKMADEVFYI